MKFSSTFWLSAAFGVAGIYGGYHWGMAKKVAELPKAAEAPAVMVTPVGNNNQRMVIKLDAHKKCYVTAQVGPNDTPIRFLLDSGADGAITISRSHAQQLGVDPSKLNYNLQFMGVSGAGTQAQITLSRFKLGTLDLKNTPAYVISESGWNTPLLGAPILAQLNFQLGEKSCAIDAAPPPETQQQKQKQPKRPPTPVASANRQPEHR